jgi:hypothetical protein
MHLTSPLLSNPEQIRTVVSCLDQSAEVPPFSKPSMKVPQCGITFPNPWHFFFITGNLTFCVSGANYSGTCAKNQIVEAGIISANSKQQNTLVLLACRRYYRAVPVPQFLRPLCWEEVSSSTATRKTLSASSVINRWGDRENLQEPMLHQWISLLWSCWECSCISPVVWTLSTYRWAEAGLAQPRLKSSS